MKREPLGRSRLQLLTFCFSIVKEAINTSTRIKDTIDYRTGIKHVINTSIIDAVDINTSIVKLADRRLPFQ